MAEEEAETEAEGEGLIDIFIFSWFILHVVVLSVKKIK